MPPHSMGSQLNGPQPGAPEQSWAHKVRCILPKSQLCWFSNFFIKLILVHVIHNLNKYKAEMYRYKKSCFYDSWTNSVETLRQVAKNCQGSRETITKGFCTWWPPGCLKFSLPFKDWTTRLATWQKFMQKDVVLSLKCLMCVALYMFLCTPCFSQLLKLTDQRLVHQSFPYGHAW